MIELPPPPPSLKTPADGRSGPPPEPGRERYAGGRRRGDSAGAWMVTFTDLVALLLTFFVMIFAMSHVKTVDWESLTESLRRHLNSVAGQTVASPSMRMDVPAPDRVPGADLDYLSELLSGHLREEPALADARLRRGADRLFLSLPADLLFRTGAFSLTPQAADAVFELGGLLRNMPNALAVVGHADPRKPESAYPSNWELSLLRAQAVAAALRAGGVEGRIRARGQGDSRFAELPADASRGDRYALARRVDLVIHDTVREPIE
jgi:chemotaxis protein MotB